MEKLDQQKLQALTACSADPAVTIYVPMHVTASPPHISENQIRFKNLITEAAQLVREQNHAPQLAADLEHTSSELQANREFWEQQAPGLLICAQPGAIIMYMLPIDTEEYVALDSHFHLAPLLGFMHDAQEFYILTLAQQNPQLFRGTMYGLEESGIVLPANARDALGLDEANQRTENQGTAAGSSTMGTTGASQSGTGWYNGRGGSRSPQESDRLRYFRMTDTVVYEKVDRELPLILAGVESETSEYREISKHPHIMRKTIAGNHANDSLRDLYEQAQAIVWQEITVPEHQAAVEEYQRLSGANPGRVTHDAHDISEAAEQGRVDKLLANLSRRTTDTIRDSLEAVPQLMFPRGKDSKWLNEVALAVWQNRGTIYNLAPNEMPIRRLAAARLRY